MSKGDFLDSLQLGSRMLEISLRTSKDIREEETDEFHRHHLLK